MRSPVSLPPACFLPGSTIAPSTSSLRAIRSKPLFFFFFLIFFLRHLKVVSSVSFPLYPHGLLVTSHLFVTPERSGNRSRYMAQVRPVTAPQSLITVSSPRKCVTNSRVLPQSFFKQKVREGYSTSSLVSKLLKYGPGSCQEPGSMLQG